MGSNFYGESSKGCRIEETDIDPPKLKKARFLWEVKGNYHLREDSCNTISYDNIPLDKVSSIETCSKTDSNKNSITRSSCNVFNRNLENLHDHCCVQSFLEKSEKFIHTKKDESSDHSSPHDDDENDDTNFLKWHTKQIIRYDIENKINAALEACLGETPNKYVDLDISDIVEDVESDLEIKDEGILMAIESHGLKTNECIQREPSQASCHIDSISELLQTSASNLNKSDIDSSDSNDFICEENSLQAYVPNNHEMNSKFWNTALSAAIYEKGLTYNE